MKNIYKLPTILLLCLFIANCSTYTVKQDISNKGEFTKTPKWYIKYQREDKKWMYETASSVSPDLELAIKKSTLLAKAKLADRINGKMNNQSAINKSENGVNSIVGERGGKISGGEKQRIGIARALYKNPSVLVLDEATSSLDLENERLIIDTISSLKRKKTIIIVSHRPSTVKICDTVYKMENGKITRI